MTTSLALAAHSLRHAARLTLLCLSATLATAGVQAQPVSAKKPSKAPTQARQAMPAPGKRAALPVAPPPLLVMTGLALLEMTLTCWFGRKVNAVGPSRPPLPVVTWSPISAPVVPLYLMILSVE